MGETDNARETAIRALDWLEERDKDAYDLLYTCENSYREILHSGDDAKLVKYMLELESSLLSRERWCDIFKFFYRFGQIGSVITLLVGLLLFWHGDLWLALGHGAGGALLIFIGWHAHRQFRTSSVLLVGMRAVHARVAHTAKTRFIESMKGVLH